jgi:hypothetical protein
MFNQFSAKDVLLVLTGGLAGAFFTQLIAFFTYLYRRPGLKLVFKPNVPGCTVDVPGHVGETTEWVPLRYLRVKAENVGRTTAHGVSVCVTKLEFWDRTSGTNKFDEEVLELPVALYSREVFDLAPGAYRYLDVFFAWDSSEPWNFRFAFVNASTSAGRIYEPEYNKVYGRGSYRAHVLATAENALAYSDQLDWHFEGTRESLTIPAN